MDRDALLPPMRFRFTHPEDVAKYGDGWFVYDELGILSRPGRTNIKAEATIGSPLADVMRAFRVNHPAAKIFVAWIAGPKGRHIVAGQRGYRPPPT